MAANGHAANRIILEFELTPDSDMKSIAETVLPILDRTWSTKLEPVGQALESEQVHFDGDLYP